MASVVGSPSYSLLYGESVNEYALVNAINNKIRITLINKNGLPLSTSAIAENWVRVVFKQDNINYTYETGKGWYTYTSRSDLIVKPGNLSEEVKERIDSAKELPSGGNEGDVLTMGTNNKPEWADDNEEFEISISFDGDGVWSLHTIGEDILNAYKAGKKLYSRVRLLYTGDIIGRAEVTSVMENPDGRHYYFYFTPINWGSGDEWVMPVVYIHTNNDVDWGQALYLSLIGLPGVTQSDEGKFLGVDSNGVWDVVNSPLPTVTSQDEGKVLTVGRNGNWCASTILQEIPVLQPTITSDAFPDFTVIITPSFTAGGIYQVPISVTHDEYMPGEHDPENPDAEPDDVLTSSTEYTDTWLVIISVTDIRFSGNNGNKPHAIAYTSDGPIVGVFDGVSSMSFSGAVPEWTP